MSDEDHDPASHYAAGEMTSAFRADFLHEPDTLATASGQGAPSGSALLVVTRGPDAGSRLVLEKAVTTVGRHPGSDIFLDDVSVSRRHAEFQVTDGNDIRIVDMGSLNGTYLNRKQVDSALLINGDEVQLGKFRLLFLAGDPHTAAFLPEDLPGSP